VRGSAPPTFFKGEQWKCGRAFPPLDVRRSFKNRFALACCGRAPQTVCSADCVQRMCALSGQTVCGKVQPEDTVFSEHCSAQTVCSVVARALLFLCWPHTQQSLEKRGAIFLFLKPRA